MNPRRGPLATTGIGSLPHEDPVAAMALVAEYDVPFAPELPRFRAAEGFLELARHGETSLVDRLVGLEPQWVKVQVAGPCSTGVEPEAIAERAFTMVDRLARDGHAVLLSIDEPVLLMREVPHSLHELATLLGRSGASVGLHCCGNTDWRRVLELPIDYVSFDARLSLPSLVRADNWPAFIARGGWLMLGIVPTEADATYDLRVLCDAAVETLRGATTDVRALLERSMLTPACGLANHSLADAERVTWELQRAQALLLGEPGTREPRSVFRSPIAT